VILPKNEKLKQMLEQGAKFLDIGCGDGNLIIQLAQAFPNSQFSGINPDIYGIEMAKNKISQLGLGERVFVDNIGGHEISAKDEFDMVSMVLTFHEILPSVRLQALENAYQALNSEGWLLILDFPPYPIKLKDFRDPVYAFVMLDQFFEALYGFIHLTRDEQKEILADVGFKDVQRTSIGRGMLEFLIARK
jgi:ubiquinone/menaquinone biosynthesis C-methylase UbiE